MNTLIAIYRGQTVADARLIAVTADPHLVTFVLERLLEEDDPSADPASRALDIGRREALRTILENLDKSIDGEKEHVEGGPDDASSSA